MFYVRHGYTSLKKTEGLAGIIGMPTEVQLVELGQVNQLVLNPESSRLVWTSNLHPSRPAGQERLSVAPTAPKFMTGAVSAEVTVTPTLAGAPIAPEVLAGVTLT